MTEPLQELQAHPATLILSDVHLGTDEKGLARRREFVAFLRAIDTDRVRQVFVLGDLFDFWFEYRHVIFSGYFEVLRAFAALRERGVELHLICGNHDFWSGRFLEQDLGFCVWPHGVRVDFAGRRGLLVHGDGLNPRDWGYRAYKRLARARAVIWMFRCLHPDRAMDLARWVSRRSRDYGQVKDPAKGAEAEALRAFARGVLERGEAEAVLCGHAHAPTYEEHPAQHGTGLYINTGDWMYHRSYVEWDGSEFTLHRAEGDQSPH